MKGESCGNRSHTENWQQKFHWKMEQETRNEENEWNCSSGGFIQWLLPEDAGLDPLPYFPSPNHLSRTRTFQVPQTHPRAAVTHPCGEPLEHHQDLKSTPLPWKYRILQGRTSAVNKPPQINGNVSFWQKLGKFYLAEVLYFYGILE